MDANVRIEKSDVLQGMKTAGWKDTSSGCGDTFRKGFKEQRKEITTVWNKLCEERFGKNLATTNTMVQED